MVGEHTGWGLRRGSLKDRQAGTGTGYGPVVPFKILGCNFSSRFRDLDDQRFWRATMPGVETGTYGVLEDLARNRLHLNLNKVITHWPDMLKVTGSLVTDQVRAYDLLRMFGREGAPLLWGRRSPSTGASPRPSTCSVWSPRSTTPTAVR